MDTTHVACMNQKCISKGIIMGGWGCSLGGRVNTFKLKCHECGLVLLIVPLKEELEYELSATTAEERIEKRIEQARKDNELELAKTITRIREKGY